METVRAQFTAIKDKEDLSPHDKFVEMRRVYAFAHPEMDEAGVQKAIFEAEPELHREYLNSNGVKR